MNEPATRAYPEPASIRPGDDLVLRVSSVDDAFHVACFRVADGLTPVGTWGPWPGAACPPGRAGEPWDWPPYHLPIADDWASGLYVAWVLSCSGGDHSGCVPPAPPSLDGRERRALFVVLPARDRPPSPFLYRVPLLTYHAYNATGGSSLYVGSNSEQVRSRRRVSLLRPGGGTGGDLSFPEAVDVYDPSTPREGAAHWDAPFIAWLDRQGYAVDFCTDVDLDADPGLLAGRRALLSVGHDEYWTANERDHVERFVVGGGNIAFFSGNTCFWAVEMESDRTAMSCAHPPVADGSDQWWRTRPETSMTGVSYRNGGGHWSGSRPPLGYTIVDAGHWVFEGTGLRDGDELAAMERLVGYECDGAELDTGPAVRAAGAGGTPGDFAVLGIARLGREWQDRPRGDAAAATMGMHRPGGMVFTAATTDWARVLGNGHAAVAQITANVLDRFALRPARVHGPRVAAAGTSVEVWVDAPPGAPCRWRASRAAITGTGPVVSVRVDDRAAVAHVWVSVEEPGGGRFGATTITVVDAAAWAQIQLLEAVRHLLATTPPSPAPATPSQTGNRELHDPRWDAVRDGLRRPLTAAEADAVATLAEQVRLAAERLGVVVDGACEGPPSPEQ